MVDIEGSIATPQTNPSLNHPLSTQFAHLAMNKKSYFKTLFLSKTSLTLNKQ